MKLTEEQKAAIECGGKCIVSASAGSGKTFVMIEKLVAALKNGADLDSVLAVTFTKKAAAQMKEKLRSAIVEAMRTADVETKRRLKIQLTKIPSSNISTIHSFCARILRSYFFCVNIDGTFDIISADDALAQEYKSRALDNLFERYYAENNVNFMRLLSCYRRKRNDSSLRAIILEGYEKLRICADYKDILDGVKNVYTEEGFNSVCADLKSFINGRYARLEEALKEFRNNFANSKKQAYDKIFDEMQSSLKSAKEGGLFDPLPALCNSRKPADSDADKLSGESFKAFKDGLNKLYTSVGGDLQDGETEREAFFESGKTAVALACVLKDFDGEYAAIKRDENKLDYNDLEHLTLAVLEDEEAKKEISGQYSYVFVDEYQDVNPVQEKLVSEIGGQNLFLVGDVKQAIYGFRGSRSLFFAEKYNSFEGGGGKALRLSSNFRSSDGVINFVNGLFSDIMTTASCGFDYKNGSKMQRGGGYKEGEGVAEIHVFGKDKEEEKERDVYSVKANGAKTIRKREGLAVLEIVERELKGKHYDLKTGEYVDTQAGDICILTRKRSGSSVSEIVKTLTDAGYGVTGAQEQNICQRPEIKNIIDILSYLDNSKQDIPLATSLLSPIGGLDLNELSKIRIAFKKEGRKSFCDCCKDYALRDDLTAKKLRRFYRRTDYLKDLAEILTAPEVIDRIFEGTGLEAEYKADGGEKLKNIRRFSKEAEGLSVSKFLKKLKDGGYDIPAPPAASSDSIKIMTMHASKGLEFPVVIIADICATFKGRDFSEIPFIEKYGFAPKCHDTENLLFRSTVLRRLALAKWENEELVNELNLFYVACTRAMCKLHIMAEEAKPYNMLDSLSAKSYSKLFDMEKFGYEVMEKRADFEGTRKLQRIISAPDEELKAEIAEKFQRPYGYENSVNLPVKSSASALYMKEFEKPSYAVKELFPEEKSGGAERGTAYHVFLQHCDFSVKDEHGIQAEIEKLLKEGKLSNEQVNLLNIGELCEILCMPVFENMKGATLYREQEFLCRMPAKEVLDCEAEDGILIQGAIDLLAVKDGNVWIVDYKYSGKEDELLVQTYSKQLLLYKNATQIILKCGEDKIHTAIVNIKRLRQIVIN